VIADDAVADAQAQAGAFADLAGRKEGIEDAAEVLVDVFARVTYRVAHVERLATTLAHAARAGRNAVNDAGELGQILKSEQACPV